MTQHARDRRERTLRLKLRHEALCFFLRGLALRIRGCDVLAGHQVSISHRFALSAREVRS